MRANYHGTSVFLGINHRTCTRTHTDTKYLPRLHQLVVGPRHALNSAKIMIDNGSLMIDGHSDIYSQCSVAYCSLEARTLY